ncbi:transcriptional regulator [Clostridia bacterium]|nr:transcriptional regulator [Clostridia bacterium]
MKEINNTKETLAFARAMSSPARVEIVRYLAQKRSANLNELAENLGVTNGAVTSHVKILHEAGIIDVVNATGKRGLQKLCQLNEHKFMINVQNDYQQDTMYQVELPVGSFIRHEAYPTCGIASVHALIGEVDDKRYFDDPQKTEAGIVWLSRGFLEYRIPNYLKPGSSPKEFQVSIEISSEAPGVCEDWPSDIYFYLNDMCLGYWTSPGDFGATRGLYTPEWWFPNWNQYGLLKLLTVNNEGSYIDGRKISDVNLSKLNIDHNSPLVLRFEVPENAENVGGITLFGKGFGNYNQDIRARIVYDG